MVGNTPGGKIDPMNLMLESLFKLDPILSGVSSPMQMCAISEEGDNRSNNPSGPIHWENGENWRVSESRQLFKKNSTRSLRKHHYSNPGTSTLPTRGLRSSLSLNLEESHIHHQHQHQTLQLHTHVGSGRFERSGSSKSYAKNSRSPLSRLWQMRRKSFAHHEFELCSATNDRSPISPNSTFGCGDLDAATAGVSGFFAFLDEHHWEGVDDFGSASHNIYSTLPKSKSSTALFGDVGVFFKFNEALEMKIYHLNSRIEIILSFLKHLITSIVYVNITSNLKPVILSCFSRSRMKKTAGMIKLIN